MTNPVQIEQLGRSQTPESLESVRAASKKKVTSQFNRIAADLPDKDRLRSLAAAIRRHTLDHLDRYLGQAEAQLKANGIQVHWAVDAAQARQIIADICRKANAKVIAKSKSMVTEEIGLNKHLESLKYEPIETDLGEYVVQLSNGHPSHIVTPIIHIGRKQVAALFAEKNLGEYTENPEDLTGQARKKLRSCFEGADLGISGANFVIAETGQLVTVSNEGNLRFCTNLPRVHVAITGIEKVVPQLDHLSVLLSLLGRSATGQKLTVYTQFLAKPRQPGESDGPEEMHLIFLDNGRTRLLGGDYHEMLQCIRCGACLNVCPVYRAVGGLSYDSVYPGPMGAIFSPLLGGESSLKQYHELPKASSLCASCEEVCPVQIPIPRMLLSLRNQSKQTGLRMRSEVRFASWARVATQPFIWGTLLKLGKLTRLTGYGLLRSLPVGALKGWISQRELPEWPSKSFRNYWKNRSV